MRSVLLLCKAFPPAVGGVETFSEQVARAYLRAGLEVTVITQTYGRRGWEDRQYAEGSVPVFNTGNGSQMQIAIRMLLAVWRATSRRAFDFYHATTWRPAIATVTAVRRRPIVISVHGREVFRVPRFLRPIMNTVLGRATVVVAVSNATRSRACARLSARAQASNWVVVGNGLSFLTTTSVTESTSRANRSPGPARLLTLARLVERKNVQGCIRALQTIKQSSGLEFEYRIAGTGPLKAALQTMVHEANLGDVVKFVGYIETDDLPSLYQWADIFLHPQIDLSDGEDFEGFGLSIADAMSFGCLVIAGNGSGPSDFIQNGVTGLLINGDVQEQLDSAVRSVLDDPPAFHSIAAAGQEYVLSELSWDKHVDRVLSAVRSKVLRPTDTANE